MTKTLSVLCMLFSLVSSYSLTAQVTKIEDSRDSLLFYLKKQSPSDYPDAPAEILYEKGIQYSQDIETAFEYEIAFKVYDVSEIGELADVVISKFGDAQVQKLRAKTYNLEGDSIHTSILEKSDLILENFTDNLNLVKFSLPNLKNGSVVSYRYKLVSFSRRFSWNFQHKNIPVRYSEFNTDFYSGMIITPVSNATPPFKKYESKKLFEKATGNAIAFEEEVLERTNRIWIRRNVPPLIVEPQMGSIEQYTERIKLRFNGFNTRGYFYPFVESWEIYNKKAWYEGAFRSAFKKSKSLAQIAETVKAAGDDSLAFAKKIYYMVQQKVNVNSSEREPEEVWSRKQANQLSIARFLCATYRSLGYNSDIVLLANKHNDALNPLLYNVDDISNIIVRLFVGSEVFVLDPTNKYLPFGSLPLHYYNGYARVVNEKGDGITLTPELAVNKNSANVLISFDPKDNKVLRINYNLKLGTYDAINIRQALKSDSVNYVNSLLTKSDSLSNNRGMVTDKITFEHSNNLEERLTIKTEGHITLDKNLGTLRLTPFFYRAIASNILKSTKERKFPLSFDNIEIDNYRFAFKLDNQFEVDELPKSRQVAFGTPVTDLFLSTIGYDEKSHTIIANYKYDRNGLTYNVELLKEYNEFQTEIIKLLNQQIVLKRKS
jgi:hypothetical protein